MVDMQTPPLRGPSNFTYGLTATERESINIDGVHKEYARA